MEKTEEIPTYDCVFISHSCPVRSFFKLRPESLAPFCATCPVIRDDEAKPNFNIDSLTPIITAAISIFSHFLEDMQKERTTVMAMYISIIDRLLNERVPGKDTPISRP